MDKNNRFTILPFIYQFLMIFGFMSKFRLGPLTSLRVVLLIALLEIAFKWKNVRMLVNTINFSKIRIAFILLFVTFVIALIHTFSPHLYGNEYFEPTDLLILVICIFIMGIWSGIEVKSPELFLKLLVLVGLLQSLCTYISAVNPGFQTFLAENFINENYNESLDIRSIKDVARAPGLGIAWSSGSLVLAYCGFGVVLLKMLGLVTNFQFILSFTFVLGATALMGRSGLIVEICLLVFYVFSTGKMKNSITMALVLFLGVFIINYLFSTLDPVVAEATRNWMFGFIDSDAVERTYEGISKGGFPPFSSEFIFGTGVRYGIFDGRSFYADSGYIKNYTSIGVIGMFCYYIGIYLILSTFSRKINIKIRRMYVLGIAVLFVMEYKEPFIGMVVYPWALFTIGLLFNREYILKNYGNSYRRGLCTQKQAGTVS